MFGRPKRVEIGGEQVLKFGAFWMHQNNADAIQDQLIRKRSFWSLPLKFVGVYRKGCHLSRRLPESEFRDQCNLLSNAPSISKYDPLHLQTAMLKETTYSVADREPEPHNSSINLFLKHGLTGVKVSKFLPHCVRLRRNAFSARLIQHFESHEFALCNIVQFVRDVSYGYFDAIGSMVSLCRPVIHIWISELYWQIYSLASLILLYPLVHRRWQKSILKRTAINVGL